MFVNIELKNFNMDIRKEVFEYIKLMVSHKVHLDDRIMIVYDISE